jgi:hypothetical protein
LAAPLTIFLMLDTFPETRWLASVMGAPEPEAPDSDKPAVGPTDQPSVSP